MRCCVSYLNRCKDGHLVAVMRNRLTRLAYLIWIPFGSILGSSLRDALAGIIGNRADDAFMSSWPSILRFLTGNIVTYGLVPLFVALPLIIVLMHYRGANGYLSRLNGLDDTFIVLLTGLYLSSGVDTMDKLIEAYISEAAMVFGEQHPLDECHAVIYRPSKGIPGTLVPRHLFNAPADYKEDGFGYRSLIVDLSQSQKAGAVASVYQSESCDPRIVRILKKIDKETGRTYYEPDDSSYIIEYQPPHFPPYRAVAILRMTDETSSSIGVLCLYNMKINAFDGKAIQQLSVKLANRLSVAMKLEEQLSTQPIQAKAETRLRTNGLTKIEESA